MKCLKCGGEMERGWLQQQLVMPDAGGVFEMVSSSILDVCFCRSCNVAVPVKNESEAQP